MCGLVYLQHPAASDKIGLGVRLGVTTRVPGTQYAACDQVPARFKGTAPGSPTYDVVSEYLVSGMIHVKVSKTCRLYIMHASAGTIIL